MAPVRFRSHSARWLSRLAVVSTMAGLVFCLPGLSAAADQMSVAQGSDGSLTLRLSASTAGELRSVASYAKGAASAASLRLAKGQLLYARSTKYVQAGRVVVRLRPTATALRALRERGLLGVKVVTRLTSAHDAVRTSSMTVTVRLRNSGSRAAAGAAALRP
jgi:hypothetical protein